MNTSEGITLVILFLNCVLVFGQYTESDEEDENIRRNILKYVLYNSRRLQDKARAAASDSSVLSQILDSPSLQEPKMKKSHLYGLNRPITLRQTRLASFGTILRPNNDNDNGTKNILRYG